MLDTVLPFNKLPDDINIADKTVIFAQRFTNLQIKLKKVMEQNTELEERIAELNDVEFKYGRAIRDFFKQEALDLGHNASYASFYASHKVEKIISKIKNYNQI